MDGYIKFKFSLKGQIHCPFFIGINKLENIRVGLKKGWFSVCSMENLFQCFLGADTYLGDLLLLKENYCKVFLL